MRNLLNIILILSSILIFSQNKKNLDLRYGIKKFKLETNIKNYSKNLNFELTADNVNYYTYNGNDIKKIFNHNIKKIQLGFYKEKLFFISIEIDEKYGTEREEIYNSLKVLFGETEELKNYGNKLLKYEWGYDWETQKTYLKFEKNKESKKMHLWMMSLNLKRIKLKDEF